MPCNSDYLEADGDEIAFSRVMCLLDELKLGKPVDPASANWQGYDPRVYNLARTKERMDKLVASLCVAFKACPDVTKLSLEAQIWWRDHQAADKEREWKENFDSR